ncbi:MAG: tetratricopeptide repeat protein, partial [Chloroflexota bacterium]
QWPLWVGWTGLATVAFIGYFFWHCYALGAPTLNPLRVFGFTATTIGSPFVVLRDTNMLNAALLAAGGLLAGGLLLLPLWEPAFKRLQLLPFGALMIYVVLVGLVGGVWWQRAHPEASTVWVTIGVWFWVGLTALVALVIADYIRTKRSSLVDWSILTIGALAVIFTFIVQVRINLSTPRDLPRDTNVCMLNYIVSGDAACMAGGLVTDGTAGADWFDRQAQHMAALNMANYRTVDYPGLARSSFAGFRHLIIPAQACDARYVLGERLYNAGQHADAVEAFDVALAPPVPVSSLAAHTLRASSLELLNRDEERLVELEYLAGVLGTGEAIGALGDQYIALGQRDVAEQLFEDALANGNESEIVLLRLAQSYRRSGDDERALELYTQLTESSPRNPDYHRERGDILVEQGNNEGALTAYDDALEVDPGNTEVLWLRGTLTQLEGRNELAVDYYRRAIDSAPNVPAYRRALGALLFEMEVYEGALGAYDALLERFPNDIEAHEAKVEIQLIRERPDLALRSAEELVRIEPDNVDYLMSFGNLLLEDERYEDAIVVYNTVLDGDPPSGTAVVAVAGQGRSFEELGDLENALARYEVARALSPDNALLTEAVNRVEAALAAAEPPAAAEEAPAPSDEAADPAEETPSDANASDE